MLPFPFNLSHRMTAKELVYFVHWASHRLCINNQELSQIQHHSHEAGVPWQLWSGKQQYQARKEVTAAISCSPSFHFSSSQQERRWGFLHNSPPTSTSGLKHWAEQEALPSFEITTKQRLLQLSLLQSHTFAPEAMQDILLSFLWKDMLPFSLSI